MWREPPATGRCADCGAETELVVAYGADHPSLKAAQRAQLRWLMNSTTIEALKPLEHQ
jgi:hypothetical protein